MELIGYLALIGLGFILSLLGGGGSLLSLPILVYLFSIDVATASSYSLFIVGASSLFGAFQRLRKDGADFVAAVSFGCTSALAMLVTRKWLLPMIPEEIWSGDGFIITKRALLLTIFSLVVMASSIIMLLRRPMPCVAAGERRLKFLVPVSLPAGIIAGLVGVGGGVIILPALVTFARLPFRVAVGTTLLVISINCLLGFLTDATSGNIDWIFLLVITAFASLGMFVGNRYHNKVPLRYLQSSFGWSMLIIAIAILLKELVL